MHFLLWQLRINLSHLLLQQQQLCRKCPTFTRCQKSKDNIEKPALQTFYLYLRERFQTLFFTPRLSCLKKPFFVRVVREGTRCFCFRYTATFLQFHRNLSRRVYLLAAVFDLFVCIVRVAFLPRVNLDLLHRRARKFFPQFF